MGGLNLRTLGIIGENLPTKSSLSTSPSDFLIGGMIIEAERSYNKAYLVRNMEEFREIFGNQIDSTQYGYDAVKGFFDNIVGTEAKLYVQTHIGYAASAIDAVVASRNKADVEATATALVITAAYKTQAEYGASGNRTGTLVTNAIRFITAASATVAATGVSSAILDSVAGIRVGDMVRFHTGALGAAKVYKIITSVDETAKTITWAGNFEDAPAGGEALAISDVVDVPGIRIQTYRKSITGIVTEVEVELGKLICSTESAVGEYFIDNIHSVNKYIKAVASSASVAVAGGRMFVDDAVPVYCASGVAGTLTPSVASQAAFLPNFDNLPIRFLANPETTTAAIQAALETYCRGRYDTPITIYNVAENRTKAQLVTIGNNFQRSDDVLGVIVANWLGVSDPFSSSVISPNRHVPNVGHVMGTWIRAIGKYGVHYIPATNLTPMYGVNEIIGLQFLDNDDRTDLAEAGINLIQAKTGIGIKIANFFTPSTTIATAFANGILMRNFIKVSVMDILESEENKPNSLAAIASNRSTVWTFLYKLWQKGSTGYSQPGEMFGNPDSVDSFQVIADITNNPNISSGERNIDVYFTYPTPAGSIKIGVGILVRS
jgi:hypothetical protein